MSFILEALRRAQNAHAHSSADSVPIFADRVPEAPPDHRQRALWLLGALLTLVLVAGLAWWFGRVSVSDPAPAATPAASLGTATITAPAVSPALTPDDTARAPVRSLDREAARGTTPPGRPVTPVPARESSAPVAAAPTGGKVTIAPRPAAATTPAERAPDDPLPQYENLLLDGRLNLPNLRLDMHVYNRDTAKRFVFINFRKYREGDALDRDTAIEEITTAGAVMNHKGQRFLLRPN